jgi:hypothetical protein
MTILVQRKSYLAAQPSVQEYPYSHLTSRLLGITLTFLVHLSWQTFTLSRPLQTGFWLLRCLHPPSVTLAFSRPVAKNRSDVWEFPSSRARNVIATLSCLLYSGPIGTTRLGAIIQAPLATPFWSGCNNHFHPFGKTSPQTQVSFVSIGHRTGQSTLVWFREAELLSGGFRPERWPTFHACPIVLVLLSKNSLLGRQFLAPLKGAHG